MGLIMFHLLSQEQKEFGRRAFLKAAALFPAIHSVAQPSRRDEPVKAVIVGTGDQGQVLLEQCNPKFLHIQAVCDIRPANRLRGQTLAQKRFGNQARAYLDYQEMLQQEEDIDAVLIATPLWMHAPVALAALQAGKHVFCEKAMAHTIAECREMLQLAQKNNLVLQVGHQRFYNPVYHQIYRMILEDTIGDIYHVRCLWHRNNDWRRVPKPEDVQAVRSGELDPRQYGYGSLEELVNWRLYDKFSGGLAAELMSHQVSITNWIFNSLPERVSSSGGTFCYQDGRNIADHLYSTFEYPGGRVVTYSAIQSNGFDHYYEQFMGRRGTIIVSGETESYLFMNPDELAQEELRATQLGIASDDVNSATMMASASRARDAAGVLSSGESSDTGFGVLVPYQTELEGFANSIRMGAPNYCDGKMGLEAAATVLLANESLARGEKVEIRGKLNTA